MAEKLSAIQPVTPDKESSKETARRRKMDELLAYDRFAEEQAGTYTAQMVCAFLKLSLQGVDYAARTGGLKFICYGRNRFFGRKSVQNYRWSLSRKFKDNPRMSFSPGQAGLAPIPGIPQAIAAGLPAEDFTPSRHPGDIRREAGLARSSSDSPPETPGR